MIPLGTYLLMNFDFFKNNLTINILLIIIFILLIIVSAFFSATEAAFTSANPIRLKAYLDEKKKGAKKAVNLTEQLEHALIVIWMCDSLVDIIATVIAAYFMYNIFSNPFAAAGITVLITGFIIVLFGNLLPKQRTIGSPEKTAMKNSAIIYVLYKIFYPIAYLMLKIKKRVMKNVEAIQTPKVTEEELESIIDTMETEGVFDEEDAELIQSAIGLNERTVYDIMTPRVDIIAIEESMSVEEMKEIFFTHQFSRVPVFREDKDNIIGVLSEKDFFTVLLKGQEVNINKLVTKPIFVSESTKVNDLIKEFQKLKKHFAIVVDEYGGTSGIVTMEDALEELVGEIYDEFDDEELDDIISIGDNHYKVSPDMDLEDLFDYLDIEEVPESQYNSVGGFVYSLLGGLPIEGTIVKYQSIIENDQEEIKVDLEFTIKTVKSKRIRALELRVDRQPYQVKENKDQMDKEEK